MKKIDIKSIRMKKFSEICYFTYVFMECKEVATYLLDEEKKAIKAGKAKAYMELHAVVILKMMHNFYGDIASPIKLSYTRMTKADKIALKLLYMLDRDQEWQVFFFKKNGIKF